MNGIQIRSFLMKNGKVAAYQCVVAGREKTLTKKQLLSAIEMVLPEGPIGQQPESTLPHDYEPNGRTANLMS